MQLLSLTRWHVYWPLTIEMCLYCNHLISLTRREIGSSRKVNLSSNWTKSHRSMWDSYKIYNHRIDIWKIIWIDKKVGKKPTHKLPSSRNSFVNFFVTRPPRVGALDFKSLTQIRWWMYFLEINFIALRKEMNWPISTEVLPFYSRASLFGNLN